MVDISKHLKDLEKKYGVRILLAVENGARNWGLDSPVSDYDVRFVFHYPIKEYLRLEKPNPVINYQVEDLLLDIQGFDIYKFVGLLAKSNANIIEWLTSNIVYHEEDSDFIRMVKDFAVNSYNPLALYYHYHARGFNNFNEKILNVDEEDATAKAYLYSMRGLFHALYVLENGTLPPSDFKKELAETNLIPKHIKEFMRDIIIPAKVTGLGSLGKRYSVLDEYFRVEFKVRKELHKQAREIMKRKVPLPENTDDLIFQELLCFERE